MSVGTEICTEIGKGTVSGICLFALHLPTTWYKASIFCFINDDLERASAVMTSHPLSLSSWFLFILYDLPLCFHLGFSPFPFPPSFQITYFRLSSCRTHPPIERERKSQKANGIRHHHSNSHLSRHLRYETIHRGGHQR